MRFELCSAADLLRLSEAATALFAKDPLAVTCNAPATVRFARL